MAFAYCPDCGERIYLGRTPWIGQPVSCDGCDTDLEVVQVSPPVLEWTENLYADDWEQDWQFESQPA